MSPSTRSTADTQCAAARIAALSVLSARLKLLEEENRWLKAQLFGRSSEKSPREDRNPDQAWLFNEIEALAGAAETAPETHHDPGL